MKGPLMPCELGDLQTELRTREAVGDGTDVRLVLLEAKSVVECLDALDTWIAGHTGGRLIADTGDLQAALVRGRDEIPRLTDQWAGLDLEEVTVRLREVADLLSLLIYGART